MNSAGIWSLCAPRSPCVLKPENAPVARGWFLGDYQGMAAVGNDLILFFAVATNVNDSADVIAIRANQ